MCFNVDLLLKAKDCDGVFVGGDPVNWVDPWGLSALGAVLTGLGTDLAAPEPSDLAWPKWAGWGAAIGGAALLDWMMNEGDGECLEPGPDHPYNPGQPTEKDGFKPPKNSNGKKTKKNGQWGWTDKNGNHWVPTNPGNAHGGPHWDVQKPGGGYVNVIPGGTVR